MLGVGLGCVDFAEDALASDDYNSDDGRGNAVFVTFFPCLACALYFPGAFVPALEFSGLFRQILFGAVPIILVIRGRQQEGARNTESGWKSRPVLQRAKSWKQREESECAGELQLLPFGDLGLGLVSAATVALLALELNRILSR